MNGVRSCEYFVPAEESILPPLQWNPCPRSLWNVSAYSLLGPPPRWGYMNLANFWGLHSFSPGDMQTLAFYYDASRKDKLINLPKITQPSGKAGLSSGLPDSQALDPTLE